MEENQKSEFNNAVGWLKRLDVWFYSSGVASADRDMFGWFSTLGVIFRELSTEMNEVQIKEYKEKMVNINQLLSESIGEDRNQGIPAKLYEALQDFEIELRKIYDDAGLQTKRADAFFDNNEEW